MDGEYTCALCGCTFNKTIPDSEALAEFEANFPGDDIEDTEVVCDNCYKAMGLE